MRNKYLFSVVAAAAVAAGIAGLVVFSRPAHAVSGWTGFRTILAFEAGSTGVEVRLDGFGGGCTSITEGGVVKTWAMLAADADNAEQMLPILLMAHAMGKQVNIYCSGSADYAPMDRIIVQN